MSNSLAKAANPGESFMRYMNLSLEEWKALQEYRMKLPMTQEQLILENSDLRGRLSFVKSRIEQINKVMPV